MNTRTNSDHRADQDWIEQVADCAICSDTKPRDIGEFCAGMGMSSDMADEVYALVRQYHLTHREYLRRALKNQGC